MSAESPRHARSGGPLTVPSQPPSDRGLIDAVSGFINDVTLSSSSTVDPKDVIQWARFETADINEPTPEGDSDNDISPLLLVLGYGSGVQVWLIPPTGEAQEVLSWRQGQVRVLRILPTPQHGDCFASKRPLVALCDSASPGPSFCSLSFISIRGGEQVKSIKFKNQILDVLANKRSVVVSFSERFAVFDAATLEDRMAITTCYPCPCPLGGSTPINPLALGDRWLAYADKKLNQSKRSSGGCESEGVTSYTATVLHAAKSLSKGLRGLGESVAHSLAGRTSSQSPSPPHADLQTPGVVTVLDIEGNEDEERDNEDPYDPMVAHFVAHSEAVTALQFDASGLLLVTADRRGHDFHVFRINPHPCGPSLASVHHLYVLHRGDTTAKVQDIAISGDSRWAAVSTLRGTTHVFALSPYGGPAGVRTHTAPRVVNRQSRFHRSAGLPIHATHHHPHPLSGSPVSDGGGVGAWFPNPRLPPFPMPVTCAPLAQLRPTASLPTHTITRTSSGRQRLSSLSEDSLSAPLLARARFGLPPAGGGGAGGPGTGPARPPPVAALYLISHSGCLSHLALHPRPARCVAKEKICDESPIELEVEPLAQWPLQRPAAAGDLLAPLPPSNPLLQPLSCRRCADMCMSEEERWLSQVEIVTHAGPHRRLWMGPQFVFKTYNCSGSSSSLSEAEAVEVELNAAVAAAGARCAPGVQRSNPVNMPTARCSPANALPVLIDSGSASECSLEHSPSEGFRRKSMLGEGGPGRASVCDVQLKEDLAEAMKEDHGWRVAAARASPASAGGSPARRGVERAVGPTGTVVAPLPVRPAPPPDDPDAHTAPNADEAAFRPVLRAPAALAAPPPLLVRPLPKGTTIPVQSAPAAQLLHSPEPEPLATVRHIPAALTQVLWRADHLQLPDSDDSSPDDISPAADLVEAAERVPDLPSTGPISSASVAQLTIDAHEKERKSVTPKRDDSAGYDSPAEKDARESTAVKFEKAADSKNSAKSKKDKPKEQKTYTPIKKTYTPMKIDKPTKQKTEEPLQTENVEPEIQVADAVALVDNNVDIKKNNVNKDLNLQENDARKRDSARESSLAECVERESADSKSLPKSNRSSDDIQPTARARLKKSPTPKSVSDKNSEVSVKDNIHKKNNDFKDVKEPKLKDSAKEPIDVKKQKNVRETRVKKELQEDKQAITDEEHQSGELIRDAVKVEEDKQELIAAIKEEPTVSVSLKLPLKKEQEFKPVKPDSLDIIKTEEQAWDMLLNDQQKNMLSEINQEIIAEDKPKVKKNRKLKKNQDEAASKEDDSFVEIHAIDEKEQCSGDLVSISAPFEDEESSTYLSKSKKRTSKSFTPEKKNEYLYENIFSHNDTDVYKTTRSSSKYNDYSDVEVLAETTPIQISYSNMLKVKKHADGTASESSSFFKELPRQNKSKSLSPYPDSRKVPEKPVERLDRTDRDIYVIDTAEEEFPDIQITRGAKPRKTSPQPIIHSKTLEKEPVVEIPPVKSWSSIAATKNANNDIGENVDIFDTKCGNDDMKRNDDNPVSSTSAGLQEKLYELCKRTDIMVAECDVPTQLNFVEQHHSVLHDLPPLEPLDFGLDDFKLEVMRDSLLDVSDAKITSPICKISIDDILSSIKETTSKVIESSSFNLIDLEKMPAKKEKGYSVVANHKITSQEVKLDEMMEKSSDDDNTSPVTSTDSDKEDKKSGGASNLVTPSSKQSAKSKKSRRKKK